jgi:hypothetical protein
MQATKSSPKTLLEATRYFADPDNCHAFMVGIRWHGGDVCCPTCGSIRVRYIRTRAVWECKEQHPKRRFSLKTGTIFEDSPLPLEKWMVALWLEVNAKNSISSWELHRSLGVTQKTAWFMLHRIRFALKQGSFEKMGANGVPVEADETFIGGLAKNMHASKRAIKITGGGPKDKTAVVGLLERHSDKGHSTVRAEVLKGHVNKSSLHPVIHKHVEPGAQIITDTHAGYVGLSPEYVHQFIDHAEKYVDGIVHTNGIENFWSLFKRCIKGTHIAVDPVHLIAYVDSEAFRFNHRKANDGQRFLGVANSVTGKRLMYKTLIGHGGSEDYTLAGK